MGNIVGSITDAIGLTNHAGEKKAAAAAASASNQAYAMSQDQIALAKDELAFQKAQYADWNNIYGDIQSNMGAYYKSLSGDKLVSLGLEKQQKEFQQVQTSIERDFAQRGLQNSGQELAISAQNKVANATARAAIRSSSQDLVNEKKMQFLGLGLGQGTQMLGLVGNSAQNINNAYSSAVNSRTNVASNYLNAYTNLGVQNMKSMQDVIASAAYIAGGK